MSLSPWLESLRPKIYAASIAPVIIGSSLAWADGKLNWTLAPLVLICAVLIQTVSNWVNDIYDFRLGADQRGRVGPRRVLAAGLLRPQQLVRASWIAAVVCFLVGMPLVLHSGWPTLIIGLACLSAAWSYTGGRYSLAYSGLGDVSAFLFFGVIGIVGTYYVHTLVWSADALVLSIGPGLLVANILGANNIRDIHTDKLVGKRTLAVRLGGTAARWMYALFSAVALIVPSVFLATEQGPWGLLPIASAPFMIGLIVMIFQRGGSDLNPVLVGSAVVFMLYSILLAISILSSQF